MAGLGIAGLFLGVLAYDMISPELAAWGVRSFPQSMTLPPIVQIAYGPLAVTFGVAVLLMVMFADKIDPGKRIETADSGRPNASLIRREWGWALTGFLAGLTILAATAQGQYLGIIGGFAALTAHISGAFGHTLQSVPMLDDNTAWRAALAVGLFPGALLSAALSGSFKNVPVAALWDEAFPGGIVSRALAVFVGGFLISVGALLGGGCTTGAFMAGFPTLSVGNFVMGMTFFAVGMMTTFLLYWGRWGLLEKVRTEKRLDLATD